MASILILNFCITSCPFIFDLRLVEYRRKIQTYSFLVFKILHSSLFKCRILEIQRYNIPVFLFFIVIYSYTVLDIHQICTLYQNLYPQVRLGMAFHSISLYLLPFPPPHSLLVRVISSVPPQSLLLDLTTFLLPSLPIQVRLSFLRFR